MEKADWGTLEWVGPVTDSIPVETIRIFMRGNNIFLGTSTGEQVEPVQCQVLDENTFPNICEAERHRVKGLVTWRKQRIEEFHRICSDHSD